MAGDCLENKNFNLNFKTSGKIFIVEFRGHLNSGLDAALTQQIEWRLTQGCRIFLFDFSGVTMLESPAVAAILTTTEKIVDEHSGSLAFCNMNDVCNRVMEMVGVFLYACRYDTSEQALAQMAD